MSGDAGRPKPQYGEYATPEQQRAAIKSPELNPHYAPPEPEPDQVAPVGGQTDAYGRPVPPAAPGGAAGPAAPSMRHPFDRIATIALLVLGLYDVIGAFSGTSSLVAQIDTMYRAFGIAGDYKATELTTTLGYVTAGVFVVLWVAAAALAAWSILRGRIAFWIPLAAGILAVFTSALMATILALHDPAFVSFYTQSGG